MLNNRPARQISMRLGFLLTASLLGMALLVGVLGGLFERTSSAVESELEDLRRSSIEEVLAAEGMALALQTTQAAAYRLLAERYRQLPDASHESAWGPVPQLDLDAIDAGEEDFEDSLDHSRGALAVAASLAPDLPGTVEARRAQLREIEQEFAVHQGLQERLVHLMRYHPTDQVREFLEEQFEPHYSDRMRPLIREFLSAARSDLLAEAAAVERLVAKAKTRNRWLALLAFALALLLSVMLSRAISRPLAELEQAAVRLGTGDLEYQVDVAAGNEFGVVASAFNQMAANLRASTVSRSHLDDIIQQLRRSLEDKELLLKEVHHRVKNNLQIISSLLRLQEDDLDAPSRGLRDSRNRIQSMALIHEHLYRSDDLANIDFEAYLEGLVSNLLASYGERAAGLNTELEVVAGPQSLDVAIPCGMIVNELVANAIEHGLEDEGTLRICYRPENGRQLLAVEDDGRGLPVDFDLAAMDSLGLRLISALTAQLGGELEYSSGEGKTRFTVRFQTPEEEVA